MLDIVKDFCDGFLSLGVPGFDLAVYRDGECIIRHTNGYSDLENKVRMTGKEKYNIYSCSKSITCTAALQLWEKGLFSLENGLSLYLGMHLLCSPAQGLRTLIYRLVKAVLFGTEDFSNIQKEISALCDYNLTY